MDRQIDHDYDERKTDDFGIEAPPPAISVNTGESLHIERVPLIGPEPLPDNIDDFIAYIIENIKDEWFEIGDHWDYNTQRLISDDIWTPPSWSVFLDIIIKKLSEIKSELSAGIFSNEDKIYFVYKQSWFIDEILRIFDIIDTSIQTNIRIINKAELVIDNKTIILKNLNKQKNENKDILIKIFSNKISEVNEMIGVEFIKSHIIDSKIYQRYHKARNYPSGTDGDTFTKLVNLMPQINDNIRHWEHEKMKNTENPIEYYMESLKMANYYIYRRINDPTATSKLTTIQGDAFEDHRKRLWEFFGFKVKGNEKEHEKQYLGGYAIDQIILWNDKLVALEEDKSRSIDKGNTEKAIIGMAKTINHYQDLKSSYWDDTRTTFNSPDEFLIKKDGEYIMPHIIIHTFAKYGQMEHELNECKDVFKDSIKDKFIYGKTFHYTTLINKSNSELDSTKKTWFYKSKDKKDKKVQKFFSDHAKIKNIINDIELIISIIPPGRKQNIKSIVHDLDEVAVDLLEETMRERNPKYYWMNQLEKYEKDYEDLIKKQEEEEEEKEEKTDYERQNAKDLKELCDERGIKYTNYDDPYKTKNKKGKFKDFKKPKLIKLLEEYDKENPQL